MRIIIIPLKDLIETSLVIMYALHVCSRQMSLECRCEECLLTVSDKGILPPPSSGEGKLTCSTSMEGNWAFLTHIPRGKSLHHSGGLPTCRVTLRHNQEKVRQLLIQQKKG